MRINRSDPWWAHPAVKFLNPLATESDHGRHGILMAIPLDFHGWAHREPPADPAAVVALSEASGIELPEGYLSLLRLSNGGEGPLSVDPGWFQLWPAEEVLSLNRGYEVQECIAGLFGFGSNGGGELLAFDTRQGPPWRVVTAPFIGMEEETIGEVAGDFAGFLLAMGLGTSEA